MTAGDRVRGETGRVELFPHSHIYCSHIEKGYYGFSLKIWSSKKTHCLCIAIYVWVCANVSVQKWEPRGGNRMLKDTGHKGVLFFKINPSKPHDSMTGEAFSRSKLS